MSSYLESETSDVKVTILLKGGYEYALSLTSDSPLLLRLLKVVSDRSQPPDSRHRQLFQIPLRNRQQGLWFWSDNLVGVITEPPIYSQTESAARQSKDSSILKAKYAQIDNFLSRREREKLLNYALQHEDKFTLTGPATNTSDYPEHRDSMVIYYSPEFADLMVNKVQKILPDVLVKLGIQSFPVANIDAQMTAHNDGHYFRIHNDNGSDKDINRVLTYVYYFYREPKAFTDGELLLYDSKKENNYYVRAGGLTTIEPLNNRIVFFYSGYLHEVLPVRCPSKAFADSRFTVNGWVCR